MLLTPEELKQQTRELWKTCFPTDSEEFLYIYFEDKYTDASNITRREGTQVVAAGQLLPYSMNFYGSTVHTGYFSGVGTLPEYRGYGLASQIISEGHRRLYEQGGVLSFLIPGSEELRHFYERPQHGAFWTSTFRAEVELTPTGEEDAHIVIEEPEEWGENLYVYYQQRCRTYPFIFKSSLNDFFAALETCDLEGGFVLVARNKSRIVGLCWGVQESDGRVMLRDIVVSDYRVQNLFVTYLCRKYAVEHIYDRGACAGAIKGAQPYAMARVVNVVKFFKTILLQHPGFELSIGIDGDLDVPENNGYYMLRGGEVFIVEDRPSQIITPGGLAAMFLGSQPVIVRNMLDE